MLHDLRNEIGVETVDVVQDGGALNAILVGVEHQLVAQGLR